MNNIIEEIVDAWFHQHYADGHTPEFNDQLPANELAMAAACYAHPGHLIMREFPTTGPEKYLAQVASNWPWDPMLYKPQDHRSDCIKACALLIAEIQRLDRASGRELPPPPKGKDPGSDQLTSKLSRLLDTCWEQAKIAEILSQDPGLPLETRNRLSAMARALNKETTD